MCYEVVIKYQVNGKCKQVTEFVNCSYPELLEYQDRICEYLDKTNLLYVLICEALPTPVNTRVEQLNFMINTTIIVEKRGN